MKNVAVFTDRDGVINFDPGHFHKIDELELFPGVGKAIRLLNINNIRVIVVTNQSVIARGLISERGVINIHKKIQDIIAKDFAFIDKFYFCPHHPDANISKYKKVCNCRKPSTGLFKQAAEEFNIDLEKSFVVGDTYKEIFTARELGCTALGVRCGASEFRNYKPDYLVENLYEAASLIVSQKVLWK